MQRNFEASPHAEVIFGANEPVLVDRHHFYNNSFGGATPMAAAPGYDLGPAQAAFAAKQQQEREQAAGGGGGGGQN